MCILFFVFSASMFVTFFFNATVHTTLPLTSSFLISLAVQFLSVSHFCFLCVVWRGVCVYVYLYVHVYVYVYLYVHVYVYVYVYAYVYVYLYVYVSLPLLLMCRCWCAASCFQR